MIHTGRKEHSQGTQRGSPPSPCASHPIPTSSRARHGHLGEAQRSPQGSSWSKKALTQRLPTTKGTPPPQPATGALRGGSSPGLRLPAAQSPPATAGREETSPRSLRAAAPPRPRSPRGLRNSVPSPAPSRPAGARSPASPPPWPSCAWWERCRCCRRARLRRPPPPP